MLSSDLYRRSKYCWLIHVSSSCHMILAKINTSNRYLVGCNSEFFHATKTHYDELKKLSRMMMTTTTATTECLAQTPSACKPHVHQNQTQTMILLPAKIHNAKTKKNALHSAIVNEGEKRKKYIFYLVIYPLVKSSQKWDVSACVSSSFARAEYTRLGWQVNGLVKRNVFFFAQNSLLIDSAVLQIKILWRYQARICYKYNMLSKKMHLFRHNFHTRGSISFILGLSGKIRRPSLSISVQYSIFSSSPFVFFASSKKEKKKRNFRISENRKGGFS